MIRSVILATGAVLLALSLRAQELYVFTEPASNIPGGSLNAKLAARYTRNQYTGAFAQRYTPELMAGISKAVQVKVSGTFSDFYSSALQPESFKGYVKWRFLSEDDIHRHFRMAAFADGSWSRNDMVYDEMTLDGDNSGIQGGIVATQLLNRLAISGTASVMRIFDEKFKDPAHASLHDQNSINYSFSAGYLLFPFHNDDYRQMNGNLYLEMLGAKGLEQGNYYLDAAPAIQLIFNSRIKVNAGARFQVTGDMTRLARNNYFLSVETSFLQVFRKRRRE
ncbi:hypothetical protein [Flavihumibacter petaseus]|uniref:Uncharacterized protein n=1 Tax=Flavihumibacter petaseus NBRC 106054 TaxID=1220578 RepID=A0A0E9N283_9BACT|nr:hypothetical protein [Flavihumibacter petaseus]GAO43425.1 hypothetical protein FPE01S_02_05300 [Flavihumibacter petaseus NBRC 106054]